VAQEDGPLPSDPYQWRNLMTTCLRRDLEVLGLGSGQDATLLEKLERELRSMDEKGENF
jgi:hypothetical protein